MRRSAPAMIFLCVLYLLAITQVAIGFIFWSSFGGSGQFERSIWAILGCGLAIAEIFALVIASEAGARGEAVKAWVIRGLFIFLAVVNLTADLAAIANMTSHDEAARAQAVAVRESLTSRRAELNEERLRLKAQLQADNLDLPADAIAAQLEAAIIRRDRYAVPPSRIVRQAAALESAHTTALRIVELERERDRIDESLTAAPPVAAHHPQFDALRRIASWGGLNLTIDQIRTGLALLLTLLLKATLAFGFWAATPRRIQGGAGEGAPSPKPLPEIVPEAAPAPPVTKAPPELPSPILPPARPNRKRRSVRPSRAISDIIKAIDERPGAKRRAE